MTSPAKRLEHREPIGWPRDDTGNLLESCTECGKLLGSDVVRLFNGLGYHQDCWSPSYPPRDEVRAVWGACLPVITDIEVVRYLWLERALAVSAIVELDLARVLPESVGTWQAAFPWPRWATYRGESWADAGYRLVVPVYDSAGDMRSLRAWRIE